MRKGKITWRGKIRKKKKNKSESEKEEYR